MPFLRQDICKDDGVAQTHKDALKGQTIQGRIRQNDDLKNIFFWMAGNSNAAIQIESNYTCVTFIMPLKK
jgi:hypothetical protein